MRKLSSLDKAILGKAALASTVQWDVRTDVEVLVAHSF
jgi:hypothetical protein